MTTLILTPNKKEVCGMYQLAKDLAKEFDGKVYTKNERIPHNEFFDYTQVITLFYPMHKHGKYLQKNYGFKWICYDQKIPPATKVYFPDFFRRQYIKVFTWLNNRSMKGADEYCNVTEREQKPRWTEKRKSISNDALNRQEYALYLGMRTDYKNFDWLQKTMRELDIQLEYSNYWDDENVYDWLSNAKMLITASLWEGYGRSVMEAEALGIPAVAYDVGAHKRHIKKGICVHLDINNMNKSEEDFKKAVLEVWNR